MTHLVTARWADAEHSRLVAETGGETLFIPADPANADYARLIGAGIEPAPFEPPQPGWPAVRADRNARLASTDWTQIADAPLSPAKAAAFAAYRQALRDLPDQFPDPASVVWPLQPEA